MGQRDRNVKAPLVHRIVTALVWPVAAYFVARLVIRVTPVPDLVAYAVCVGAGVVLGYRAFVSRVELQGDAIVVHNTLATATVERRDIKRINETGRIEWHRDSPRAIRLPAEALHNPRWTLGTGAATYEGNRERVRDWLRSARRRAGEQESYTDVLPAVPPAPPSPGDTGAHPRFQQRPPAQPDPTHQPDHPQEAGRATPRWIPAPPPGEREGRGPDTTGSLPKVVPGNTWTDPLADLRAAPDPDESADDWLRRWDERNLGDQFRRDDDWRQSGTG